MHWWVLIALLLGLTGYMGDLGMMEFPRQPVIALTGAGPTFQTLCMFLVVFGLLGRMLQMERRKEKETLRARLKTLEKRIDELQRGKAAN